MKPTPNAAAVLQTVFELARFFADAGHPARAMEILGAYDMPRLRTLTAEIQSRI